MKLPRIIPAPLRRWIRTRSPAPALPPRKRDIIGAFMLGIALVWPLGWLLYGDMPWLIPTSLQKLRTAAVNDPPWVLFSSLAAAPSLYLTWLWRTVHKDEDAALAKRVERNTRFADAVRLLGDEKLEAKLGGIYTLEALGTDAPEDINRIVETLCAVIRTRGREPATPVQGERLPRQPEDVQAAFTVLGRMSVPDIARVRTDLAGTILKYVDGAGAVLHRANFFQADLTWADFLLADLSDANLASANLTCAGLAGATLTRAKLVGANLTSANLGNADLTDADLTNAECREAYFGNANLAGAKLNGARFFLANLSETNITEAQLLEAYQGGAKFSGAKLPSWWDRAVQESQTTEDPGSPKKPPDDAT